jgi:hypothetical protein
MFIIHYYVPEEDNREEKAMDEVKEFQFQEIMFPSPKWSEDTREEKEMNEEEEFQFQEKIMFPGPKSS